MKITLINVQISEGNNIVPPLGILYIASVLERMGHELRVFDIDPVFLPELRLDTAYWTDHAFISRTDPVYGRWNLDGEHVDKNSHLYTLLCVIDHRRMAKLASS